MIKTNMNSKKSEPHCVDHFELVASRTSVMTSAEVLTLSSNSKMDIGGDHDHASCHRENVSCKEEHKMEGAKVLNDRGEEERSCGSVLNPEFQRIRAKYTTLASTGCGCFRFAVIE